MKGIHRHQWLCLAQSSSTIFSRAKETSDATDVTMTSDILNLLGFSLGGWLFNLKAQDRGVLSYVFSVPSSSHLVFFNRLSDSKTPMKKKSQASVAGQNSSPLENRRNAKDLSQLQLPCHAVSAAAWCGQPRVILPLSHDEEDIRGSSEFYKLTNIMHMAK